MTHASLPTAWELTLKKRISNTVSGVSIVFFIWMIFSFFYCCFNCCFPKILILTVVPLFKNFLIFKKIIFAFESTKALKNLHFSSVTISNSQTEKVIKKYSIKKNKDFIKLGLKRGSSKFCLNLLKKINWQSSYFFLKFVIRIF